MRARLWLAFTVVLLAIPAWAAEPPAEPGASATSVLEQNARDFERDTALGAVLSARPGTDAELKQLQALASSGLRAAEEAVAKYPDNAQACYLLGSWLLYGYGVKEVRQVVVTRDTAASGNSTQVVQGLEDDVDRGLAALKKAADLEPDKARYVIDYGAALFDCDRLSEAMGYLKSAWATKQELAAAEKLEIALLLSRIYETQGQGEDAREWVYSGLAANPENVAVVQHLRWLDKALPEAEQAAAAEAAAEEAAGIEQVKQGESRVADATLLSRCPFELEVGETIWLAEFWEGTECGFTGVTTVPGTGKKVASVDVVYAGDWVLTGLGEAPLRMFSQQPENVILDGSSAQFFRRSGQRGRLQMGDQRGPEAGGINQFWADQPFEIWKGETLVAQFANTADFQRAISGQSADEPAQ